MCWDVLGWVASGLVRGARCAQQAQILCRLCLMRLLCACCVPAVQGVLVVDRINGVAYVALSERADRRLAEVRAGAAAAQ